LKLDQEPPLPCLMVCTVLTRTASFMQLLKSNTHTARQVAVPERLRSVAY
jgi:hypothetical protein